MSRTADRSFLVGAPAVNVAECGLSTMTLRCLNGHGLLPERAVDADRGPVHRCRRTPARNGMADEG